MPAGAYAVVAAFALAHNARQFADELRNARIIRVRGKHAVCVWLSADERNWEAAFTRASEMFPGTWLVRNVH